MLNSNANVFLTAKVISEPKLLKKFGVESIYEVLVSYKRLSGKEDIFILDYSEVVIPTLTVDSFIEIEGELRSVNITTEGNKHFLKVFIFGKSITPLECEPEKYTNKVIIGNAELIATPTLRKSYTDSSVNIADAKLRVVRKGNKESLLNCSFWNNLAKLVSKKEKGDTLSIEGMLQSYKLTNGNYRAEISAYSINSLEVEDDKNS